MNLNLETLTLLKGSHESVEHGLCVMEAVAYVAGEQHSDRPRCASTVIGGFLRSWNDSLNDEDRQILRPYIPRIVGTAGTEEQERRRSFLAQDWIIREFTPTWLELAGLTSEASTLRSLPEITSFVGLDAAMPALEARKKAGAAAWSAGAAAAWAVAAAASRVGANLRPTVEALQQSALRLLDRMIAVTEVKHD